MASLLELQPALAQSSQVDPGVRLQAGIEKEDVDGDLKSAMMSIRKSPLMYWRIVMCAPGRFCDGWMRREAGVPGEAGLRANRA
jgi:hypothetical protein